MITDREKALWDLLDDIDTASDMFRPDKSGYTEYVYRKCEERHKYLKTNGYNLYEYSTDKPVTVGSGPTDRSTLDR